MYDIKIPSNANATLKVNKCPIGSTIRRPKPLASILFYIKSNTYNEAF